MADDEHRNEDNEHENSLPDADAAFIANLMASVNGGNNLKTVVQAYTQGTLPFRAPPIILRLSACLCISVCSVWLCFIWLFGLLRRAAVDGGYSGWSFYFYWVYRLHGRVTLLCPGFDWSRPSFVSGTTRVPPRCNPVQINDMLFYPWEIFIIILSTQAQRGDPKKPPSPPKNRVEISLPFPAK